MRTEDKIAVWMRLKLVQIMGQKRRCLCLNVKLCHMKAERQEEKKQQNLRVIIRWMSLVSAVSETYSSSSRFSRFSISNKEMQVVYSSSYKALSSQPRWRLYELSSTPHLRRQEDDNALIFGRGWTVSRNTVQSGCLVSRGSLAFLQNMNAFLKVRSPQ